MQFGIDRVTVFAEGLDHPEGVTVTSDGTLYAGGENGQIYRVDPGTGSVEQIASTGGFMLGLAADGNGRLYGCDVGLRQVVRCDPVTGTIDTYSDGAQGRPLVNPNWPVFDSDGHLYVTDSGTWKGDDGCILRVDPGGATQVWSDESSNFPNGACLLPDASGLLVLESCTPALALIPIGSDGKAGPRRVLTRLDGTVPDGVALDQDGNAFVCCYRPDRILYVRISEGAVEVAADDPEGTMLSAPTNGVWYGPAMDQLVTGNLGRWHLSSCDFGVKGIPLVHPELPG